MSAHPTADLRNIAITGHAGAGKTTLIENLLHHAGKIGRVGTIEEGTTTTDFEAEEREHQHSLNSALVDFEHEGKKITLIDTPGFPDFIGQSLSVMPAVETVAVVIGADKGIATTTRRVMNVAGERKLPRIIIVNKMSDHLAELEDLVNQIRETFGSECIPVNIPTKDGSDVIDLWEKSDGDTLWSDAATLHSALVDQCVEVDEDLMAVYLERGEVSIAELHDAFEKALREAHLVPIVFVSAKTQVGMKPLLHFFANLCPSPLEGNPRPFELSHDDGTSETWSPNPANTDGPFVAHVFKIATDQFVGKLALARVHQGTLKAGDTVFRGGDKKGIRLAHFHAVFGKDHHEIKELGPGDIFAIAKVEELHFNDVLHTSQKSLADVRFVAVPMPRPMYGLAVEAKNRGDEAKIAAAIHKLEEEDPTFKVERVVATHQTVMRGMGDLHLRVVMEKLHNRFKLDIDTKPPRVPYKETVTSGAEGHHRHKKQTGGAGQFGEVYLRIEPILKDDGTPDETFEFVDETVGGSIPRQFLPAIEKGIRGVLDDGAVAGYPLTGVRVKVYDGKHHPVDSKEIAFITAGKRAFVDAVQKAKPALLEPFVDVEITAPQSAMGDIASDLSSKRGAVQDTLMLPGDMVLIHAKAPLAEMTTFSNELKSITAGQGSFVMDYSHDERTPPNVQQDIIAAYKPRDEED